MNRHQTQTGCEPGTGLDEAAMRRAVRERDTAADGRFYYAVVTTGVYCRPSCAARPARPENLRFYPSTAAAAAAGYRPCRRCRPDQAAPELAAMADLARYIEAHSDQRLTLEALAARSGMSRSRLQRCFKAVFGLSPHAYQNDLRLGRFKSALRDGDTVTEALHGAGFSSPSRLYGNPARNIGMNPSAYRSGGAGETIDFAVRQTELGALLMAATDRGVCFAQFGADEAELRSRLAGEFPHAELRLSAATESPALDAWLDALTIHLRGVAPCPELPLDLRGTAFQMAVWRFLLSVPEGNVVSYGEVAAGIERPTAVRAAAAACAANRIAVLVPCHRVLRGNGDLGGYRWGVERKRALLDLERRRVPPAAPGRSR